MTQSALSQEELRQRLLASRLSQHRRVWHPPKRDRTSDRRNQGSPFGSLRRDHGAMEGQALLSGSLGGLRPGIPATRLAIAYALDLFANIRRLRSPGVIQSVFFPPLRPGPAHVMGLGPISQLGAVMTGKKLQQGQPSLPKSRAEDGSCNARNHRHVSVSRKASRRRPSVDNPCKAVAV